MRRTLFFLLLAALALAPASMAQAERKVALVIGNSAYKHAAPLANPANDARLMAESLKSIGFELVGGRAYTDVPTKAELDQAVRRFGEMIRGGGVGVFFYAGHGVQVDGKNYLIPVGADVTTKAQIKYELVDADYVLDEMAESSTKVNLVILDACRNNPFAGRGLRAVSPGLATVLAPKGTLIAYSTAPGKTASDGTGRNSPFTESLARHLKAPGQRIEDVFINVGVEVEKATGGEQSPWQSNSLRGVFCLSGACGTGTQVASLGSGAGGKSVDLTAEKLRVSQEAAQLRREKEELAQMQSLQAEKNRLAEERQKIEQARLAEERKQLAQAKAEEARLAEERKQLAQAKAEAEAAAQAKKQQQLLALAPVPKQLPPQQALPTVAPGQVWRDPITDMLFVWVPGGTYEMGCGSWASECASDERPAHRVALNGFWLGRFEVTQGQWKKILGSNPSKYQKGDNYPVEQVTLEGAKQFIARLNAQSSVKYRLPTEAEWEYAARSGGKNEKYPGGIDQYSHGWYKDNSGGATHVVGTKEPNGLGLYDMSGNVDEWCVDTYADNAYASHSSSNPKHMGGFYQVRRGGSYASQVWRTTTTSRGNGIGGDSDQGFRLVREP